MGQEGMSSKAHNMPFVYDRTLIFFIFSRYRLLFFFLYPSSSCIELCNLTVQTPENYTMLWRDGKISNYEYLVHLNTLADRTVIDIMQYPVFPWVIADYNSEVLGKMFG
jgi:hypothetical protein